jgi:hypothetical protein
VLTPDGYDPDRAHLFLFNGAKAAEVSVDVGSFLKPGEAYRLMNPEDAFGAPLAAGACEGPTIGVPLKGGVCRVRRPQGLEMSETFPYRAVVL